MENTRFDICEYGAEVFAGAQLCSVITSAGYEAYLVGGCVRDIVLGNASEIHDVDIATNMPIPDLKEKFFCKDNNGEKHGTILVCFKSFIFEVTQFRTDGDYTDGRHPDYIQFTKTFREDVARRDFTINAMGLDCNGYLIDYFGGEQDLKNRILRTVGCSETRFDEDGLRILRALRFASRFDLEIESHTLFAIVNKRHNLKKIARERIGDELIKASDSGEKVFLHMIELIEVSHIDEVIDEDKTIKWESASYLLRKYIETKEVIFWNKNDRRKIMLTMLLNQCEDIKKACEAFRFDNEILKTAKYVYGYFHYYQCFDKITDFNKALEVYTHKDFEILLAIFRAFKIKCFDTDKIKLMSLVKNVWGDRKMLSEILLEVSPYRGKDFGLILDRVKNDYFNFFLVYGKKMIREEIIDSIKTNEVIILKKLSKD